MSRDPYRASTGDLGRGERWDRDRFLYERDRDRDRGYADERVRYEEDDRLYASRAGPTSRMRDLSLDDRFEQRRYSGPKAYEDDDVVVRDRRTYYDDDPRYPPRRQRSPPSSDFDRRVVIERDRERVRSPSPPRRPGGLLRRQSSLDTFDRLPRTYYERDEYGPPARRDEFRPPKNVPIPLPRSRALPPPRVYADRQYYDEIKVSDPDYYGDDDFRPAERVREREIVKTRRRHRSPDSRASRSVRSSSRSSVTSSSSSSSGGTTVKSEYPKKGKTRIPARLVSKQALRDLRYPFMEEGSTIVVLKALGQENIDDLLKLSEDYKKSEIETVAPRPEFVEERRQEIYVAPQAPPPPPVQQYAMPPPPAPPVEVVNTTRVVRDVSPARSYTTTTSGTTSRTPVVIDARGPYEVSEELPVGPLALVTADSGRHRSRSRNNREIRAEIRDLERQLGRRERRGDRDVVAAERLSNGELVLFEEKVERVEEPYRGVRIEKDKKGPPPGLVRAMLATLT
ncbi:Carboxypeptidase Y [Pleurostoma richardsiae]|uniref:Carboxypeptidase Y n=1 Tax=Pleurostoma richardsiae TaxID=41990 RepID=A0AA38RU58_9PEZI|nr:Carboxypeptidase Y [Pleurostoma richardsiae]